MNKRHLLVAFFLMLVLRGSVCVNSFAEEPPLSLRPGSSDESTFHMIDTANGWARGTNAILKTADGGHTWQNVLTTAPREPIGAFFYDEKTAWTVVGIIDDATNVTIFHTTDGGRSWSTAEVHEFAPVMSGYLSFPNRDSGWLMLIPEHGMNSMPGDLFHSDDGGKTWRLINSARMFDGFEQLTEADLERVRPFPLCGGPILFQDSTNGWLVGSFTTTTPGYLFVTHDAGARWQGRILRSPLPRVRAAPIGLPRFSPRSGTNGTLDAEFVPDNPDKEQSARLTYYTKDRGLTWELDGVSQGHGHTKATIQLKQSLKRTERIAQLEFVDQRHGWAVTLDNNLATQLFQTTNSGQTWTVIRSKVQ